jgi:hypothetical protein
MNPMTTIHEKGCPGQPFFYSFCSTAGWGAAATFVAAALNQSFSSS